MADSQKVAQYFAYWCENAQFTVSLNCANLVLGLKRAPTHSFDNNYTGKVMVQLQTAKTWRQPPAPFFVRKIWCSHVTYCT